MQHAHVRYTALHHVHCTMHMSDTLLCTMYIAHVRYALQVTLQATYPPSFRQQVNILSIVIKIVMTSGTPSLRSSGEGSVLTCEPRKRVQLT